MGVHGQQHALKGWLHLLLPAYTTPTDAGRPLLATSKDFKSLKQMKIPPPLLFLAPLSTAAASSPFLGVGEASKSFLPAPARLHGG